MASSQSVQTLKNSRQRAGREGRCQEGGRDTGREAKSEEGGAHLRLWSKEEHTLGAVSPWLSTDI